MADFVKLTGSRDKLYAENESLNAAYDELCGSYHQFMTVETLQRTRSESERRET